MDIEGKIVLFTEKVVAGSRNYFFDVKESKDGTKYLVINESKKISGNNETYDSNKIMIFEEHLGSFAEGIGKAFDFLGIKIKNLTNLEEIRRIYPKAYERWTSEEDNQLKGKYLDGVSINELASFLERKPSAIRSRLAKLNLTSV